MFNDITKLQSQSWARKCVSMRKDWLLIIYIYALINPGLIIYKHRVLPGCLYHILCCKIQCQGHGWKSQHQGSNILSTHIPFVPCQSAIAFLIYDKIWPWKSMIKVMVEVKVENHKVGVTSNRLTPFPSMPIDPSIPEIETFLNSTVKIQRECEMTMVRYTYRSRRFHITSNGINPTVLSEIWLPKNMSVVLLHFISFAPWKNTYGENGQITMTL